MKLYLQLVTALFFLTLTLHSQSKKPLMGKEPAWVTIRQVSFNETNLDGDAEDGYIDVLFDKQVNVGQSSVYCRKVIKILTEAGIQNSSEVSINFDPAYQQLIFHTINIRRGEKLINQLVLPKIKTIQQEKDLHRFLYNGSLTSVLFLEGVQKGDIIEYSYTIKGFNPIFEGHYSAIYNLNYGVPVYGLYYRLITPSSKEFHIKNTNTEAKPTIGTVNNEKIFTWSLLNVKPLLVEDDIPSSYEPYATVQVSDYAGWKEVNEWAMKLFPDQKPASIDLQNKINEIKSENTDQESQILSALRFVQDDIRYMGIEMGTGSHKPGNPDKIYMQRFGDCKDKSYLLCTILRQLGIESDPVLINSELKKSITEWLPSATGFDHTTVRVKYKNSYYWFDPTISFQRGRLKDISYPDYQYGLVVSPTTSDLTAINSKEPGMVKVNEEFEIKDMTGKAKLVVMRMT